MLAPPSGPATFQSRGPASKCEVADVAAAAAELKGKGFTSSSTTRTPIHVDELARLCVETGAEHHDGVTDAVGQSAPHSSSWSFGIRDALIAGPHCPSTGTDGADASRLLGRVLRDVPLTADEYRAMAAGLAGTDGPAIAPITPARTDPAAAEGRM